MFKCYFRPADRCKDRWRNLRDTYIKNVKSKEQLMSRGLLKEFREYKYSEAMKFLSATIMKKTTKKSQNSTIIQNPAKIKYNIQNLKISLKTQPYTNHLSLGRENQRLTEIKNLSWQNRS